MACGTCTYLVNGLSLFMWANSLRLLPYRKKNQLYISTFSGVSTSCLHKTIMIKLRHFITTEKIIRHFWGNRVCFTMPVDRKQTHLF